MKKILLLILLFSAALIINNCDDAGVTTVENSYEITGTISGWTQGVKILKAYVKDSSGANWFLADSTEIANDGSFSVHLKTPPDNFFWPYTIPTGTNCTGTFNITPSGLKQTAVSFDVYSDATTYIGKLQKNTPGSPVTPGSHFVSYLNFKDAGTATGSMTCITMIDTTKVTANVNSSAGWNSLFTVTNQNTLTYREFTVQSTEPAASQWYFVP